VAIELLGSRVGLLILREYRDQQADNQHAAGSKQTIHDGSPWCDRALGGRMTSCYRMAKQPANMGRLAPFPSASGTISADSETADADHSLSFHQSPSKPTRR